jgi:hypothetical protein
MPTQSLGKNPLIGRISHLNSPKLNLLKSQLHLKINKILQKKKKIWEMHATKIKNFKKQFLITIKLSN